MVGLSGAYLQPEWPRSVKLGWELSFRAPGTCRQRHGLLTLAARVNAGRISGRSEIVLDFESNGGCNGPPLLLCNLTF